MRKRLAAALAAAGLVVALVGCSASGSPGSSPTVPIPDQGPLAELDLAADPRTVEGPSTAVLAGSGVEVLDPPAEAADPEARVLGLDISGSIAATIAGLGLVDLLIGRDISTTFPGTEDLPVVTSGGHTINAESVLALRPSLVITDGTIGPRDVMEQLREAGIEVVFLDNEPSYAGAERLARDVAATLGVAEAGERLATRIADEVGAKIAEIAAVAPTADGDRVRMLFLYLRGGSGIYYLFGEESGADELIHGLGGIDVAGEIGWEGMRPMSDEALVAANPDLILVMTDGLASAGGVDALLQAKPALALTLAGQHRRFVDMADGAILSFGPRSAAVLDALARAVYAP